MRIHHVALRTVDLARLERFYVGLLGLAVLRRNEERSTWLDAGGTIVMLERSDGQEPAIPIGTKELVAFAVEAHEGNTLRGRLEAAGVVVEDETRFTVYVRDPDGRRIGLSSYPEPLAGGSAAT